MSLLADTAADLAGCCLDGCGTEDVPSLTWGNSVWEQSPNSQTQTSPLLHTWLSPPAPTTTSSSAGLWNSAKIISRAPLTLPCHTWLLPPLQQPPQDAQHPTGPPEKSFLFPRELWAPFLIAGWHTHGWEEMPNQARLPLLHLFPSIATTRENNPWPKGFHQQRILKPKLWGPKYEVGTHHSLAAALQHLPVRWWRVPVPMPGSSWEKELAAPAHVACRHSSRCPWGFPQISKRDWGMVARKELMEGSQQSFLCSKSIFPKVAKVCRLDFWRTKIWKHVKQKVPAFKWHHLSKVLHSQLFFVI